MRVASIIIQRISSPNYDMPRLVRLDQSSPTFEEGKTMAHFEPSNRGPDSIHLFSDTIDHSFRKKDLILQALNPAGK